ncbi:hypothetical protein BG004_007390 [Podila humilis]|nr:hypothetical protein BG004_007390 [Podila humilis]
MSLCLLIVTRITLVEHPTEQGSCAFLNGLYNNNTVNHNNNDNNNNGYFNNAGPPQPTLKTNLEASLVHVGTATQNEITGSSTGTATPVFSISDFLVPGIQPKGWEDWQVADELNPFASGADMQDFSAGAFSAIMPFDLINSTQGLWDTNITGSGSGSASGLPMDQAYDEFVFDLNPSNFQTPATVNIADLIAGPDAPTSVSPLDLSFPINHNNYQDLALANLYGFTEQDDDLNSLDLSDSGSDLSEVDSDLSSDGEENENENEDMDMNMDQDEDRENEISEQAKTQQQESRDNPAKSQQPSLVSIASDLVPVPAAHEATVAAAASRVAKPVNSIEDVNKRRMEEALVSRIGNDLGPEHMAGLFRILKGMDDNDSDNDEDDEMEVDLSCLDESTLVQVYQYVEACAMQTVGSIVHAAEKERERERQEQEQEQLRIRLELESAAEEGAYLERERLYATRTPELSPSYSTGSSNSPSPPHPSSFSCSSSSSSVPPPPVRSGSNSNNKRRSAAVSSGCTVYREHSDVEQESLWMGTQVKSKRKRNDNNSAVCMGGGGTSKGRRIQKLNLTVSPHHHQGMGMKMMESSVGSDDEEMEEYGEDDEIDVVGF